MPRGIYVRTEKIKEKQREKMKNKHVSPMTEFKKGHIPMSKLHPEITPRGKNHYYWKGGKIKHNLGYIWIHSPKHPFCNCQGYVLEHRLVIEKQIGRYLLFKEQSHHCGKRNDNRPHMLMAFVSNSAHMRFHKNPDNVKSKEIIFDGRRLK